MDYEMLNQFAKAKCDYVIWQLSETRPQEMIIMGLLVIAIGIGIANLIAIRKK